MLSSPPMLFSPSSTAWGIQTRCLLARTIGYALVLCGGAVIAHWRVAVILFSLSTLCFSELNPDRPY